MSNNKNKKKVTPKASEDKKEVPSVAQIDGVAMDTKGEEVIAQAETVVADVKVDTVAVEEQVASAMDAGDKTEAANASDKSVAVSVESGVAVAMSGESSESATRTQTVDSDKNAEVLKSEEEESVKAETKKGRKGQSPKDPNDIGFGKGLKIMLGFLKPWRALIIVAIVISSLSVANGVVAPQLLGKLMTHLSDAILKAANEAGAGLAAGGGQFNQAGDLVSPSASIVVDMTAVGTLGIILASMYFSSFVFNYLQNFIMAGVSAKAQKRVRERISKKINVVPIGYFDKNGYGDTLSRMTNDTSTMGQAISDNLSTTIQAGLMIVATLVAMFVTAWQLALIVVATVPISFMFVGLVTKMSQKYYAKQREYLGQLNGQIEENYGGQAVVLAFRGQKKAQAKFDKTNKKLAGVSRNAEFLSGIMFPIIIFVANLGYVFVCIFGTIFAKNGALGGGDTDDAKITAGIAVVVTFLVYVRLFNNPLGQVAQGIAAMQGAAAAAGRIEKFLVESEQVPETPTKSIEKVVGNVEFEHVKFGYLPEKTIIKDFSCSVKAGQKIAIVGPTGAGKTTLVNLLMRFYELNSGTIKIDGVPTTDLSRTELRKMFAMVLQDTWLFEGTIKENIVYNKQGVTDEEIKKACKAAGIHHFIKTLKGGYDHQMTDDSSISVGQRQLLTIARAMVQNAPMLILDEATSNVDTRTEQLIQEAMDKVAEGKTSFVIAHRLSTIKNADLILVLKEGDIIENGNHDQLIAQGGFYCDLYNSQFSNEAE
ncbi:MAG: ABC transporter ATP-binding protein/permease [Firmicutes bacterium]|nr:ABC transporter ATP-binding protein/permease [Bacillota bacterium]